MTGWQKGSIAQWLAHLHLNLAAPGSILSIPPKISEKKIVAVSEVNQQSSLEESEPRLENVDWTHLVLASGKLVL